MYYAIVNPASKSGKGMRIWEECRDILQARGISYEVFFSKGIGQIKTYVEKLTKENQADSDKKLKLLVFGGDGTMNEVVSGVEDLSKVSIGYVPTGSSNDLARDLGLKGTPAEIMEKILEDKPSQFMDIGHLVYETVGAQHSILYREDEFSRERRFAVSFGIGFDAAVCEEVLVSKWKKIFNKLKLGKLIYVFVAVKQLITTEAVACELYLDDKKPISIKKFLFIAGMNRRYEGGGFLFGPHADSADGMIDVCVAGNLPKAILLLFVLPAAYFGKHFMFPKIDEYRAKKIRIHASRPLWVHTDGEVYVKSDDIRIRVEKNQIEILN